MKNGNEPRTTEAPIPTGESDPGKSALNAKAGESLSGGFATLAGSFCDEKLRDDSQDFFTAQNLPGSERVLQNAKDGVNACIELRSLQQANLSAYLRKPPANTTAGTTRK